MLETETAAENIPALRFRIINDYLPILLVIAIWPLAFFLKRLD